MLKLSSENRDSIDSELASMPPHERVAYLQEFEHSDKHDAPKKGGLIEKLIARGNKRTEDQLAREAKEREEAQKQATHATMGPGVGASTHSAAGPTTDTVIR
jgi:predicted RecB family nuclease